MQPRMKNPALIITAAYAAIAGVLALTGRTQVQRGVPPVPEQTVAAKVRTDTEDKLWEALHAAPNSTAADLSAAAKIGKSTAQKILVKWAT